MNHLKSMVGLLFACLVLVSCEKEVLTPNLTQEIQSNSEKLSLEIRNGVPSFPSAKDYFSVLDQLSTLNEEDLNRWEKAQGFVSYRTVAQKAIAEINAATSVEAVQMLARKHHLFVEKSEFGYKVKLDPAYAAISNDKGMFYIGTTLNIVQGNYLVALEEENLHLLDQVLGNPASFQAAGVTVTKLAEAKFSRTCGDFVFDVYQEENYRVVIALASKSVLVNQLGAVFARSKVDLIIQADVYQGDDVWLLDDTEVFSEDVSLTVKTLDGPQVSIDIPDIHTHGGKGFVRTWVGNPVMYPTGTIVVPETTMITVGGKAYSKRLGANNMAEINCQ